MWIDVGVVHIYIARLNSTSCLRNADIWYSIKIAIVATVPGKSGGCGMKDIETDDNKTTGLEDECREQRSKRER